MVAAKSNLQASNTPVKNVPVATFKSSLRRWQAQYKAQRSEAAATATARLTAEFLLGDASATQR